MIRTSILASAAAALLLLGSAAHAQTTPSPASPAPASNELTACKATALIALTASDATIKDIYFDEDGMTIATSDTKIEDTPVKRIIMGDAFLQTNRSDKPRRFLCLIGDKGKVLLTFFTQQ